MMGGKESTGHSCLKDIRGDLLGRLFGKGHDSEFDRSAGQLVLHRFAEALRGELPERELAEADFEDWCDELLPGKMAVLKEHASTRGTPPSENEPHLQHWFSELVGFALMRVDPRYRRTYYIDILHELLTEKSIESVMKSVRVPFDEGSVGAAARHGRLSLADSVMDIRGVVATEDLQMGNISIMMVGVGDLASDGSSSEPRPRWSPMLDLAAHPLRPGGCAAVVFCFFPLAGVFEDVAPAGTEHVLDTFESVCRLNERAILADIRLRDAEFVSEQTDQELKKKSDGDRDPTLDVLASTEIRCNPTGGMIAVRRDPPAIRVCIPHLEAALRPALAPLAQWFPVVPDARDRASTIQETPSLPEVPGKLIATMLNRHVHQVTLPSVGPRAEDPPMMIVLHAAKEVDAGKLAELGATRVRRFLDEFHQFTRTRKDAYARPDHPVQSPIIYRAAKVTEDACQALARFIARGIVSPEDVDWDAPVMDRSLRSALRHLGACPPGPNEIQDELKKLVRLFVPVATDLLAVSVHYWDHHHLEPVPPETPEDDSGTSAALRERILGQPAYLHLLRRATVRAFFHGDVPIDPPAWWDTPTPIVVRRGASHGDGRISVDLHQSDGLIGTMWWKNEPGYRIAGLALNGTTFQDWLQERYVEQKNDRGDLVDDLVRCMGAHKDPVDLHVAVYTIAGNMSRQGTRLADRLGEYEQRLEDRATAEWSLLVQGILHHLSQPLSALDRIASTISSDDFAEHKIRHTVRTTWRWTEAVLMLARGDRVCRPEYRASKSLAHVIDAALSLALVAFSPAMTPYQAECWSLDHHEFPGDHMWSKLNPPSDPREYEQNADGLFQTCKAALPSGLTVEPQSWPVVEVQGSLLLLGVIVELFRNALKAAGNTARGCARLTIDVELEPSSVVIVIDNSADPDEAQRLCDVDERHRPGHSTGGVGVDFIGQQARMLNLGLSRSWSKGDEHGWCWVRTRVRVPNDWAPWDFTKKKGRR